MRRETRNWLLAAGNSAASGLTVILLLASIWVNEPNTGYTPSPADVLSFKLLMTSLVVGIPSVILWCVLGCWIYDGAFEMENPFARKDR